MASKISGVLPPVKAGRPRRHFVEHRAEAEQVRARVQLFTPRLLRRHIGRSALRHSGAGEVCGIDRGGWRIL